MSVFDCLLLFSYVNYRSAGERLFKDSWSEKQVNNIKYKHFDAN